VSKPINPLGPEPRSPDGPDRAEPGAAPNADQASARPGSGPNPRLSRIEEEVERLRRSPRQRSSADEGKRADARSGNKGDPWEAADKITEFFSNGAPLMGIFSRTRDIVAANFNDMLDKADDPTKMIRMIILEMEETLVEVRASAARTIADQKEMHRKTVQLDRLQDDWGDKAQLALSKDREDLARAALVEKKKAADISDQLKQEIAVLDDALRAYEQDIQKLQNRLREARSRQTAIAARLESAENRVKLRTLMSSERTDDALARFDQLERRVDYAEGRAESLSLAEGGNKATLADEISALEGADAIDDELEQMKRALGKSGDTKQGN
jgi:phage shock protein A